MMYLQSTRQTFPKFLRTLKDDNCFCQDRALSCLTHTCDLKYQCLFSGRSGTSDWSTWTKSWPKAAQRCTTPSQPCYVSTGLIMCSLIWPKNRWLRVFCRSLKKQKKTTKRNADVPLHNLNKRKEDLNEGAEGLQVSYKLPSQHTWPLYGGPPGKALRANTSKVNIVPL